MSALDALDPDHSGQLSDAALLALQLHHQPFDSQLRHASASLDEEPGSTALPFSDAVTEEQLADIKQALITGDDLLLILGEKGSGKTTLVQQLNANSGLRIQCFSVTGSERFSTLNLFAGMLEAFQHQPPQKLKDILDELTPCLQSMAARNTLSVIVMDDAHKVNQTELTQLLSGMLYMNSQDETLVRVALAATMDFEDLIPELLPEGADMPYSSLTIEGFSPQRAAAYLDYRLGLAGFEQEFPFTERDMASLVDHSDGRPSELHALTADVLNEKYGRLEDSVPHELLSDSDEGFLSSRKGKFALGIAATALILGGLLMFLPEGDQQGRTSSGERVDVAERETDTLTPELTLIDSDATNVSTEDAMGSDTDDITNASSVSKEPENVGTPSTATEPAAQDTGNAQSPAIESASGETSGDEEIEVAPVTELTPDNTREEADENLSESSSANETQAGTDGTASDTTNNDAQANSDTIDTPIDTDTVDQPTEQITSSEPATENLEVADTESSDNAGTSPQPDDTATDSAADPVDADLETLLESPSWVLVQDENQFTIQMSASRDLPSVQNFLRRNPLPSPNSIFSFEREGDVWYALVHGIFPTFEDAQRAVEAMSASAQRDQPWIRSIARVKEIQRQE
ncbi:MAG: AAA family ATPase [Granulosicoccus sp.]